MVQISESSAFRLSTLLSCLSFIALLSVVTSLFQQMPTRPGRARGDRLVWQVCAQQSWGAIGDAWFADQRYLDG